MFGCILGQPVFRGHFHTTGASVESVPECFRTTGVNLHLYHRYLISLILYTNSLCGLMHQEFHFGSRYLTAFFMAYTLVSGGGLAAVIYIDVVQVTIMVAGSSVLLFRGLSEVGGWEQLQTKQVTISIGIV